VLKGTYLSGPCRVAPHLVRDDIPNSECLSHTRVSEEQRGKKGHVDARGTRPEGEAQVVGSASPLSVCC
jgi:hypothetical protein